MHDIDDISSRSLGLNQASTIIDIDDDYHIPSRQLNRDEPKPQIILSRDLLDKAKHIDARAQGRTRLPMNSARNIASVRIIPDHSGRSDISARSYRAPAETRKPDKNMSMSERSYIWRMKFMKLNARNPRIPIPDTNNPEALERLYLEAISADHYCSSTSTWLIYMGLGYSIFQYGLNWMGIKLPSEFSLMQMQVMSCYPELLKSLGDPGGPSIGSSWPPWLKLMFVMCVHTILFIIIYKLSNNNADAAHRTQRFICSTGFMGGTSKGEEVEADNAMANITGLLGSFIGGNKEGGGITNIFQSMVGQFMNSMGSPDEVGDIDLENPPMPVSERSSFDYRKKTHFD